VLPPVSPRSPRSPSISETFSQSSAMREAQDMLRRNRQRRQKNNAAKQYPESDEQGNPSLTSPNTDSESGTTWESGSDFTGSSVWTDNSANQGAGGEHRNSRRALILQMAKARMKSNKNQPFGTADSEAAATRTEEEKKVDGVGSDPVELDLTGDLD